jgi:hypothetical protein
VPLFFRQEEIAEVPVENDLISDYENSKMYMRSLKVYGGQFSVLADDIRRWFITLWQGKTLAYTVASITIIIALILYVIASDPHFKTGSEESNMKYYPASCCLLKSKIPEAFTEASTG